MADFLLAIYLLLSLASLGVGEVRPCTSNDTQNLLLGNTETYEFDVGTSQSVCATNRTNECDEPFSATHWEFVPNPSNTAGSYVVTPTDVSPLDTCVRNSSSGEQSLLVELPDNGVLGQGGFTVEFSPTGVASTSELQVSYFPHGFSSQSDFFLTGEGGLPRVWKSYGVCHSKVTLCELKETQLMERSTIFRQPFFRETDECDLNPPFSYDVLINGSISPEDSRNYTVVLVEGDCNNPRVTSDPVTIFVVYTPPTTPFPTVSVSPSPPTDSPSSDSNTEAIVGGVIGGCGVLLVVALVILIAGWWYRRSKRGGASGEEGVDSGDKSPPTRPWSPPGQNNYGLMPGRIPQEEAFEMPSVELPKVSATEPSSTVPEADLRTIAVVTSGDEKESESLGDSIVQRHERCERKEVELAGHSDDLQEYIFEILSNPSLDWFYVIWHDSLEKLHKDDESAPVSLWRLIAELKSFPLPEDQRKKVVLVQLGAPSTIDHRNGLLTLYISLPEGDCSEAQLADLVFGQMENRDKERRMERERSREVPNERPAPKDRNLLNKFLHRGRNQGSHSAPLRRNPRMQQLATNGASKSASGSTQRIADTPKAAAAEDGRLIEVIEKLTDAIHEHGEDGKKHTKLLEMNVKLHEASLGEQRKVANAAEHISDTTVEMKDLHRQQLEKAQDKEYPPDDMEQ